MMNKATLQRRKSERLVTTTPETSVGTALKSIKPQISSALFHGLEIQKVSSNTKLVPRILTLSDDLFTLFVSHHKVGKAESLSDRFQYKSFKAYASVVKVTTGTTVQNKHDIRVIDVADILFVQSGFIGSRKLEACRSSSLDQSKVISIFHNNSKSMDFQVKNEEDRMAVLNAIQTIRETFHAAKIKVGREELLLRYSWYDTDWNKSGYIDQQEFLQLLGRINIYMKQERAIKLFKDYITAKHPNKVRASRLGHSITKNHHGITFEECLEILRDIKGKEMGDEIFDGMFGCNKDVVTAEEFLTVFLRDKQNERNATIEDVKGIFSDLNSMEIGGAEYRIDVNGKGDTDSIDRIRFGEYLTSSMNDVFDPEKQKLDTTTLSRPLSEYWINSSHNTYLTGDQLKSISSVEMYVVAMQRGCKCLELDCWDDGSGYPIVYHGYTLTSKIQFSAIIRCVKGYLDANPGTLPIILSLENHCSHPFQEKMASILTAILEDKLYVPDSSGPLPSPLDLVGKVVVKGKRPPENEEEDSTLQDDSTIAESERNASYATVDSSVSSQVGENILHASSSSVGDQTKDLMSSIHAVGKDMLMSSIARPKSADTPALPKIVPELAQVTLFNGVKFKSFNKSIDLPICDMHSFSETKITKTLNKDPDNVVSLWREYNKQHLTRCYPAGARVDSSNYNPTVSWYLGSQLVALNFQTSDDSPMTINDGRFRENGGCGYVYKDLPPLSDQEISSGCKAMSLRIRVLAGSCLPKPYGESVGEVIDPYLIVRLHDVKKSESISESKRNKLSKSSVADDWLVTTERKTKSIRDNGFSCKWAESDFVYSVVSPDVAMVEFIVMDSDAGFLDDTMCKTAVPVSCLRKGIRSIQFYDQCSRQHGPFEMARVLVDVDIKHIV